MPCMLNAHRLKPGRSPQAVVERLWLALPRQPSPMPSVPSGVRLGARAPSAPLPALVDDSKPPALVLGGGTAQACSLRHCGEMLLCVGFGRSPS